MYTNVVHNVECEIDIYHKSRTMQKNFLTKKRHNIDNKYRYRERSHLICHATNYINLSQNRKRNL